MFFLRPELLWYFSCLLDILNLSDRIQEALLQLLKSSHRQGKVSAVSGWQAGALRGAHKEEWVSKQEERKRRSWP